MIITPKISITGVLTFSKGCDTMTMEVKRNGNQV